MMHPDLAIDLSTAALKQIVFSEAETALPISQRYAFNFESILKGKIGLQS